MSPLLLANAGLSVGDVVSVSTIATSGVELLDADKIALIYDSKGKAGKDSFFEAYVKEVLGECLAAGVDISARIPPHTHLHAVDIKYVAINHFIEVTYNGVIRRLLVTSAKGTPVVSFDGTAPSPSGTSTGQAYVVSRSTTVTFRAPGAASTPSAKNRAASSNANGSGTERNQANGNLPGYEQIGGLETQIEQIRELVEWPLTRPELFSHFGAPASVSHPYTRRPS